MKKAFTLVFGLWIYNGKLIRCVNKQIISFVKTWLSGTLSEVKQSGGESRLASSKQLKQIIPNSWVVFKYQNITTSS